VDAAADYLIVPNPYLALGADLVAYSGGKIIRGPQGAGLLLGRRDLVRAAWANSAPHHAFGRALKVTKEEIIGMLRAVEAWRSDYDLAADFRTWESWYAHIADRITKVAGVRAQLNGPVRGGPFPTLSISWEAARIGLTAGEVGRLLLEGEPRIMTQAEGEGHQFLLRPVALKPGEYEIVARRLYEVFSSAGGKKPERTPGAASVNLTGTWDVEIQYEVGSARHRLFLAAEGNRFSGTHSGWAYQGDLKGEIDGDRVTFRSMLPADGNVLTYAFHGTVTGQEISGDVRIGEYGSAKWRAQRHG
jgi:L-seryl-tRNA(Ser) seleniumtransferase